jgi:4-hydroxy-2-oxoheptanedioate aldolase
MTTGASFRQRVRAREVLLGTFLQLDNPVATEIVGRAGFDWLLVDLEHGAGSEATLVAQFQALGGGPAALVRVENGERLRIGRALDAGANGIMVPRVGTADEAARVARFLRYPPDGVRGVALGTRAAGFGRVALGEVSRLNEEVVGPADLSLSLGIPGQLDHPEYRGALERVLAAGARHGKAIGTLLRNAQEVEPAVRQGITFLGIASEATVLANGVRALARDARAAVPELA